MFFILMDTNKFKNNIRKYYLYQIFYGVLFAVPTIVVFWQNNWLNLTQIMILQSLYAVSVIILEIPTWYFADMFGRKFSLLLAWIVYPIWYLVYWLWQNLFHFFMAEFCLALAFSFLSWAESALIYDSLKASNRESEYKKIYWNWYFLNIIFVWISWILWWLIVKYWLWNWFEKIDNFRLSLFASVPFLAMMIPVALSMKEPIHEKFIVQKNYFKDIWLIIKGSILKKEKLLWLIIYSWVIYWFYQSALWFYQPYFDLTWIDIVYFWIIFASFQIFTAIAWKFSYNIEKKLWAKYSIIMLVFLVWIGYILMWSFVYWFSFSFCFIQQFIRWFYKITISDYINKLTDSSIRATVLSIQSLFWRLIYALIIPTFWLVADIFSLKQALIIIWITSLVFWWSLLFVLHKKKII